MEGRKVFCESHESSTTSLYAKPWVHLWSIIELTWIIHLSSQRDLTEWCLGSDRGECVLQSAQITWNVSKKLWGLPMTVLDNHLKVCFYSQLCSVLISLQFHFKMKVSPKGTQPSIQAPIQNLVLPHFPYSQSCLHSKPKNLALTLPASISTSSSHSRLFHSQNPKLVSHDVAEDE